MDEGKNSNSSESYETIKYILASEIRLKLLLSLYDSDKNLENLRKDLGDKKSTNILRGLNELNELDLINKSDKIYSLTSVGYLVALNIANIYENWSTLNKQADFWGKHYLIKDIPARVLKDTHVWKNAEYVVSDNVQITRPLNEYLNIISRSKDLKIILPISSELHVHAIINALIKNDGKLELITSDVIYDSIISRTEKFSKMKDEGKIDVWIVKNRDLHVFLTCTDIFSSLSLFFNEKEYDDSSILLNKDISLIEEATALFDFYKTVSEKV